MKKISHEPGKRTSCEKGLFRAVVAGHGASLSEVFAHLEGSASRFTVTHHPQRQLSAARIPVPPDEGDGEWELINLRDQVFVVVTNCLFADTRVELVPSEEFIEFHFTLVGPVQLEAAGLEQVEVRDPLMVICKQGAGADYTVWGVPGTHHSVSLYCTLDFLVQSLGLTASVSTPGLNRLLGNISERLLCYQLPIKISLADIARQLMALPYEGYRRLLYAEAKVNELLCLCIDELLALRTESVMEMFTARELRMFEEVRRVLASNYSAPPTISELARLVGTNTTKLKRGFKLLYGMTIFEFGHQHRMQHALRLLAEEKLSVAAVAKQVGYQHQASFASAFKEHFAFLPKEARRLQRKAQEG